MTDKIVRAIITDKDSILLCKNIKSKDQHYFLPGGHIEEGEKPEETLEREFIEEINQKPVNLKYLTEVRNSYTNVDNGKHYSEIFYVYKADIENKDVTDMEEHIRYQWVKISDLGNTNFKPQKFLKQIIEETKK